MNKYIKSAILGAIVSVIAYYSASSTIEELLPVRVAENTALQLEDSTSSAFLWKWPLVIFKLLYIVPIMTAIMTLLLLIKGIRFNEKK